MKIIWLIIPWENVCTVYKDLMKLFSSTSGPQLSKSIFPLLILISEIPTINGEHCRRSWIPIWKFWKPVIPATLKTVKAPLWQRTYAAFALILRMDLQKFTGKWLTLTAPPLNMNRVFLRLLLIWL